MGAALVIPHVKLIEHDWRHQQPFNIRQHQMLVQRRARHQPDGMANGRDAIGNGQAGRSLTRSIAQAATLHGWIFGFRGG